MTTRFMIIDAQAEFRSLLMHHITTRWPDATITSYDPVALGHLPDEFSGAGNDVIMLGSRHGDDRDGVEALERFLQRRKFPPVIYFATNEDAEEADDLSPDAVFIRNDFAHDALIESLEDLLLPGEKVASTGSLFVGGIDTGSHPVIKGYSLMRKLSSTAYSGVYLAEQLSSKRQMVLKVLRQMPGVGQGLGTFDRFLQEYETIADLDHPNIVKIYDLGVSDDHAHIAMEYIEGGDLGDKIDAGVSQTDAVNYFRQVASSLAAVHAKNILHRDLKPANVMVRADGSVALIDFGLAKRAEREIAITARTKISGTPFYMSPEQGHGNTVDARSDIYSLGAMFFELLTGDKPFTGDTAMGVIYQHAQAAIPSLPDHLSHYQDLIDRLLAKKPEDRLQSAAEIEAWL